MEQRIVKLEEKVGQLYEMIAEAISSGRNSMAFQCQLDNLRHQIEEVIAGQVGIIRELKSGVKDEDFKKYYELSQFPILTVKHYVESLLGKEISMPSVYNYVNGKLKDPLAREKLFDYLKDEADKKAKQSTEKTGRDK